MIFWIQVASCFGSKRTFSKPQHQYQQISPSFNVNETVAIAFNLKGNSDIRLELSETSITLSDSLIYLGMSIGRSIKETIKFVIQNLAKKIRIAYASHASNNRNLSRFHLSKLYNNLNVPNLLAMSPIWKFFLIQIKIIFTKFILNSPSICCICLLGPVILLWYKNSNWFCLQKLLIKELKISNPPLENSTTSGLLSSYSM